MKFSGKIQIAAVKDFFGRLSKKIAWVFFAAFIILLFFEMLEVKKSLQIILSANREPPPPVTQRGVRINFSDYDKVVQKIQGAQSFIPSDGVAKNPFGIGQQP